MAKRKDPVEDEMKTSLKLPPMLWRKVRAHAVLQGKTASALVVEALEKILKEQAGGRS